MKRMKRMSLVLSAILVLAATIVAASPGTNTAGAGSGSVNVMYAGSLVGLMQEKFGPAFTRVTGYTFQGEGRGSVALANLIKARARTPDIFISADPKVNTTLQGPANGNYVSWWTTFAATEMVIGWSPKSKYASRFRAIANGKNKDPKALTRLLATKGLRFGRTDPQVDPKGYRTLFQFYLDGLRLKDPGLSKRVLGAPDNPEQIFLEEQLVARLQTGELDAGSFYKIEAVEAKLPFLTLPKEINLATTSQAKNYAKAKYTNSAGVTFVGAPIVYTVTIPSTVRNRPGAIAFVRYLLRNGQKQLRKDGLRAMPFVLAGDRAAVPAEIQPLVKR